MEIVEPDAGRNRRARTSEKITPAAISSRTAVSNSQSIVNHQLASKPLSVRLISIRLLPPL